MHSIRVHLSIDHFSTESMTSSFPSRDMMICSIVSRRLPRTVGSQVLALSLEEATLYTYDWFRYKSRSMAGVPHSCFVE